MGFLRFNRRIKLLPGVTLNLSKKGISTSLGPHGAKITVGHGKTRMTAGLPGTGLSHTTIIKNKPAQQQLSTSPIKQHQSSSYPKNRLSRSAAIFWFLVVLLSIFGIISALVELSLR
jgi:hypothetical protein